MSLYALQRLQDVLPLNPQGFAGVPADLAFNTSISFITNTNWQNYSGETTMSHLTQMLGLTVHNFVSAATGLAMAFALVRGFRALEVADGRQFLGRSDARRRFTCCCRSSIVVALALVALGVPQTLAGSVEATTLEGAKQIISIGPVASQEAIKELGTNGGGFFNANSAHPFENPNAWSNMLEIWALLRHSLRVRLRLRPRGRRLPAGARDRRHDGHRARRRRRSSPIGRRAPAIRC